MIVWRVVLASGKEWDIEANGIEISNDTLIFWIDKEILVSYSSGSWISVVRKEWGWEHMTCLGR